MILSINKLLKEITARTGPRTGAFEIDKNNIDKAAKLIYDEFKYRSFGGNQQFNRNFVIRINNPITGHPTLTEVILGDFPGPHGENANWDTQNNIINLYIVGPEWMKKFENISSMDHRKQRQIEEISSLLYHELTHKFDPNLQFSTELAALSKENPKGNFYNPSTGKKIRKKTVEKKKYISPEEGGYFRYLNQKSEIKSHLQQVVQEILERLPSLKMQIKQQHPRNYKMILRLKSPEELLELSATWNNIKDSLNELNERLFLKAAARLKNLL